MIEAALAAFFSLAGCGSEPDTKITVLHFQQPILIQDLSDSETIPKNSWKGFGLVHSKKGKGGGIPWLNRHG